MNNRLKAFISAGLLCLAIVLITAGCGKKAPPLPPIVKGNKIASPANLKYTVSQDTIFLTWNHTIDNENARIEPDAFDVFAARMTFEACEGCPFKFELVQTVPVTDKTCTIPVEKGYRYYFRVQAVNEDDLRSDYSKTVQYEYK